MANIFHVHRVNDTITLGLDTTTTTLTNSTATRLLSTGSSKELASVSDLTSWVAGTANQITVTDDGDGTITLSTPQDIHTSATPQFAKLGIGVAAPSGGLVSIQDTAVNTTVGYVGFYNDHRKTAGVTDHLDYFYGHQNYIVYNQTGGVIGTAQAFYNQFSLVDGDIGDASNSKNLSGVYSFVDLDGGKIYGNVFGFQTVIDQEIGNEVTGDIYGNYVDIDADGTTGGSVYGLYLNESSNIDYGIYQNGSAPNVLASLSLGTGELTCGSINRASGTLTLEVGGTAEISITSAKTTLGGTLFITEQAAAEVDVAGQGQIWVKNTTPNELWFTDDAGTDTQLGVGGADEKVKIDSGATADYIGAASNDGVLRTSTGLSYTDGGNYVTLTNTGLLTDGTAGRTIRFVYLIIEDGTNASTLKCTLTNIWNGDTIAATDNISKGGTTGNFNLSATGKSLIVLDTGLTGDNLTAFGNISNNTTGTAYLNTVTNSASPAGIQAVLRNLSGAAQDLTALVDSGYFTIQVMYIQNA